MRLTEASAPTVRPRRWTTAEYERLGELGILGPEERVELIEGEIVKVPPQQTRHSAGVFLTQRALLGVYGPEFMVRAQAPLSLGEFSQPEPDVSVVAGEADDFLASHPTTAVLVVEVSDTSLAYDRNTKSSLYAAAGIPEYWVVNLVDRQLEIHRDRCPLAGTAFGFGYGTRTIVQTSGMVTAPGSSGTPLLVDRFFPRDRAER